ncbi:hypothetical protein MHYP_G00127540 [Metynnis hypsauchen]
MSVWTLLQCIERLRDAEQVAAAVGSPDQGSPKVADQATRLENPSGSCLGNVLHGCFKTKPGGNFYSTRWSATTTFNTKIARLHVPAGAWLGTPAWLGKEKVFTNSSPAEFYLL